MSETSRPVCASILGNGRRGPDSWRGPSLEDSARCGCYYCSAVCENRPELANRDEVSVEMLKKSLHVTYRGADTKDPREYPRHYYREFFTLNGKPARIAVDDLL